MKEQTLVNIVSAMLKEVEKLVKLVADVVTKNSEQHRASEQNVSQNKPSRKTMNNTMINRNNPRMETINKTAEITGLSKHFIRQKAISGEIVCVKAGNKYLINIDKLIEYLNSGDTLQPAPTVSDCGIKPIPVKL